jgi:hypothetical protein
MRLYGRWQPYVDAGPAREHVRLFMDAGIGFKRVAALAGIPASTVSRMLYGRGSRPPSRRIRPGTEAAILAAEPSRELLAGRAVVDGTATRRRLRALVATGRSKAYLAARLGMLPSNFGDMMERGKVTAATDRAVAALYDELWDSPPPETTQHEKISASRARNYAAARDWALPQQWDDETIADPGAAPAERRRESGPLQARELAAEARELLGYGLSRGQAAARLGVRLNTMNRAMERFRHARQDAA